MKQQEQEKRIKELEKENQVLKDFIDNPLHQTYDAFIEKQRIVNKISSMGPIQRLAEQGRIKFESGMVRDGTKDKPRFDLIWPDCIPFKEGMEYRLAVHMAKGAAHYSARNWEKADGQKELDRFRESARRHFTQWYYGEQDEDHASATFFNITGFEMVRSKISHFDQTMIDKDDLSKLDGE